MVARDRLTLRLSGTGSSLGAAVSDCHISGGRSGSLPAENSAMAFIIWVETRVDGRTLEVREVAKIERTASGIDPEELWLTLQDGKTALKQVHDRMVRTQVELICMAWRP
jgi:hypothetical protein